MFLIKTPTIFIVLELLQLQSVYSQWEGYNTPPCYYNSYSHSGYPYPYSQHEGYDSTTYGQTAYPYGAYVITGFNENYGHNDNYDLSLFESKQPIIIVVENKQKHDEFCFDDLVSLSLDLVKKLPKDTFASYPSTWCNSDCCETKNSGRFEFYSECNCGPCNDCSSCNKKSYKNKSSCKSECGCHSCNSDCCRNCGNCKHIMICECY